MKRLEDAKINRFEKIERLANLNPIYCKESDSILAVTRKMLSTNYRRMPVLSKSGSLTGIVTYMDILDALLRNQNKDSEISNIMKRDVIFCDIDDTISFVLQKLKMSRRGGLPVLKKGKLVGMISERDFVKCFLNISFGVSIKEIMTPRPFYISPKLSIIDGLKAIANTCYRRLPVVDKGILIGIITAIDLLKHIDKHEYNLSTLSEPIGSIIKTNVHTISGGEDVTKAIELMKTKDVGGILVVDKDNKLEGIVTERDILEQIA